VYLCLPNGQYFITSSSTVNELYGQLLLLLSLQLSLPAMDNESRPIIFTENQSVEGVQQTSRHKSLSCSHRKSVDFQKMFLANWNSTDVQVTKISMNMKGKFCQKMKEVIHRSTLEFLRILMKIRQICSFLSFPPFSFNFMIKQTAAPLLNLSERANI
jgi:hypothetical protein